MKNYTNNLLSKGIYLLNEKEFQPTRSERMWLWLIEIYKIYVYYCDAESTHKVIVILT